ncbi:hypothetical protein NTGBS_650002 [Candidatus Nitrotoga sp. BS]|uniref:hypothetical protein n=1 Tax=Candidatus Nitrotoga sp. BS TaxID=2890408 RepID=UPI001EF190F8|nr:hypothetical protein [Candidatus Nitrotoga sp. BS]CAH1206529.1 hypothetical protein NTGBS_650002 [Candidatus Nitrotoga sp. BS]
MNEKLIAHMQSFGPKKILALDGGGIRCMIIVRVLEKIETLLSQKRRRGIESLLSGDEV